MSDLENDLTKDSFFSDQVKFIVEDRFQICSKCFCMIDKWMDIFYYDPSSIQTRSRINIDGTVEYSKYAKIYCASDCNCALSLANKGNKNIRVYKNSAAIDNVNISLPAGIAKFRDGIYPDRYSKLDIALPGATFFCGECSQISDLRSNLLNDKCNSLAIWMVWKYSIVYNDIGQIVTGTVCGRYDDNLNFNAHKEHINFKWQH